jgi:hypothetical protein
VGKKTLKKEITTEAQSTQRKPFSSGLWHGPPFQFDGKHYTYARRHFSAPAASVTVLGCEGDIVTADTGDSWGLQIGKRSDAEIGRARAAIGDFVLFDIRVKSPLRSENETQEVFEVQIGGSGANSARGMPQPCRLKTSPLISCSARRLSRTSASRQRPLLRCTAACDRTARR